MSNKLSRDEEKLINDFLAAYPIPGAEFKNVRRNANRIEGLLILPVLVPQNHVTLPDPDSMHGAVDGFGGTDEESHYTSKSAIKQAEQQTVDDFNTNYKVGTTVNYWPGVRQLEGGIRSTTRSKAELLGGHTSVVWVQGHSACIALSHIQPLKV